MLNAEPSTTSDILSKKASNDMSIVPAPPPTHHLLSYLETGNCVESTPARNWNYRVIEFVTEDGEVWRSIHEVHYVDGVPKAPSQFWERWIFTPMTQATLVSFPYDNRVPRITARWTRRKQQYKFPTRLLLTFFAR